MPLETDATKWAWDDIEKEVVEKIRVLRAAATETEPDWLREKIVTDLIAPAMSYLAAFCECVTEEDELDADNN